MTETLSPALCILAAGSLRQALPELLGAGARMRFGPAGTLRREIEAGAECELFLSANLAHPEALAARQPGREVVCFASNDVVALARHAVGMTTERFLDVLLDPTVRLGCSTPGADPGGDYAMALFARAGRARPGAATVLADKARHLVGGWGPSVPAPSDEHPIAALLRDGTADVFLCYRSTALAVGATLAGLAGMVTPPTELGVRARYGGVVLAAPGERAEAASRILHDLSSPASQCVLARHGFGPPD